MKDKLEQERTDAWTGDAVLSLFARQWILRRYGRMDGDLLGLFTSNQFLLALGNPTSVEAKIGRIFEAEGMAVANAWIERELVPLWEKRLSKKAAAREPGR
ncbi:MAG TPA: hypothetical protein VIS74_07085 [Chthoniobacterales bacterium]